MVEPMGVRAAGSRWHFLCSFYLGGVVSCPRAHNGAIPLETEGPCSCWSQQLPCGILQLFRDVFLSDVVSDSGPHKRIDCGLTSNAEQRMHVLWVFVCRMDDAPHRQVQTYQPYFWFFPIHRDQSHHFDAGGFRAIANVAEHYPIRVWQCHRFSDNSCCAARTPP